MIKREGEKKKRQRKANSMDKGDRQGDYDP